MIKRIVKWLALTVITLLILITIGFLVWTQFVYKADTKNLSIVLDENSSGVKIHESDDFWEIAPREDANASQTALIYYPGAKVEPQAYFFKLYGLANGTASNMRVFVTKPTLNLAVFSINQANAVIAANPKVKQWIIGGHSLGGAMACEFVARNPGKIGGIVLFASYCSRDISLQKIGVFSIFGTNDGILDFKTADADKKNLPPASSSATIAGMNHAQFGNYGEQRGDNPPKISDAKAREELMRIYRDVFRFEK